MPRSSAARPPAEESLADQPPAGRPLTSVRDLRGDGPWVVRVRTADRATIDALAAWADIWSVEREAGVVDRPARRPRGARAAPGSRSRGRARPAARPTSSAAWGSRSSAQASGIPGYPCYRTVEETFASAQAIVAAHPDLATWIDVGDSWEKSENPSAGYDLMVLRLTQSAVPGPKPILFANFAIHAREYTTAELGTRFAELLVAGYGIDPDVTWILDHHEVHLLLQSPTRTGARGPRPACRGARTPTTTSARTATAAAWT